MSRQIFLASSHQPEWWFLFSPHHLLTSFFMPITYSSVICWERRKMSQSHGHQIHVIHELVITCTPTKIVPWQIIVHLSWFLSGEEWIALEIFSNLYLNWLSLIDGFFYWYFYFGSFLIDWSFIQILIVLFFNISFTKF